MNLSATEIATYRSDFLEFAKYMFHEMRGAPMKEAEFHRDICDKLERCVLGSVKRLIINIPPRSGKTEFAVKLFMAWCMGNWADSEFIHASYSKTLAALNTAGVRAIMQHESYEKVFGKPNLRNDSNAKDHFRTKEGGVVYAAGTDGTLTGLGAGKMRDTFGGAIIIDDPHKASEAASDTMRQNVLDWFSVTMESRLNNQNAPIIVIMQRLHEEDLSGWLLDGGNGEEWEHLCIEAIKPNGESFWPDNSNFTLETLRRKEKANSYVFAGQYMQRPAPIGGGILKDAWWRYWSDKPMSGAVVLPKLLNRTIYADTAQKTKEENDFSVFQCWGTDKEGRKYLLDQIRGKWEAPELMTQARAFWRKHKAEKSSELGYLKSMNVEDKVSGTGLIQTLSREGIPVRGIKRNIDKVTRGLDAAPMVETGNVFLPIDAPWLSDFLAEASAFPNGKHDDQLDPMFDAVVDVSVARSWAAAV
jgi:predicted phage terminase large subunit-like protein